MKGIHSICLTAALALVAAGCQTKQEISADVSFTGDSVKLSSSGISAPAEGTEVTVSFTSAISWTATAEDASKAHAPWVVINPAAGKAGAQTVTVYIYENSGLTPREAVITIASGEVTKTIKVTQAARESIAISEIVLSADSIELNPGEEAELIATVIPSNADEGASITWSTSDEGIATVEDGVVTAIAEGTATITATVGELSASCEVTVLHLEVPVEGIELDNETLTLTEGDTGTLTATLLPENADPVDITWTSSDEAIATVADGVVTAVYEGTASITASAAGFEASCEVTVLHRVIEVETVTLDRTEASVNEAETITLTATVLPENADDKTVTWTTSDETVATVEDGVVTGVKAGTAVITATSGSASASCTVTVVHIPVPVESVTLNETALTLVLDQEVQLTATVNPENADDPTVTWSSSNPEVATVSESGLVKVVGEGEAVITATAGEQSATCAISVPHVDVLVESVTLDKTSATLLPNDTLQLTATVNPDNADDKTVTWSTSDPAVATVSETGLVKAIKAGKVTVTAAAGGKSATCEITVKANGASGEDLDDPIEVDPWQ